MKKFFSSFVTEEDGIETIEFIALVAVAAILIGVIVTIGTRMNTTAGRANTELDTRMGEVEGLFGGGSGEGDGTAAAAKPSQTVGQSTY